MTRTRIYSKDIDDYVPAVKLSAKDVRDAIKEFKLFLQHKGDTYERCPLKDPFTDSFVELYFGEWDDGVITPNIYDCSNKNVAKELYDTILCQLAYHDTFMQKGVDVELNKNRIEVWGFSY